VHIRLLAHSCRTRVQAPPPPQHNAPPRLPSLITAGSRHDIFISALVWSKIYKFCLVHSIFDGMPLISKLPNILVSFAKESHKIRARFQMRPRNLNQRGAYRMLCCLNILLSGLCCAECLFSIIHTHAHTHTHTYTHTHTHTQTNTHAHPYTHMHTRTRTLTRTHVRKQTS